MFFLLQWKAGDTNIRVRVPYLLFYRVYLLKNHIKITILFCCFCLNSINLLTLNTSVTNSTRLLGHLLALPVVKSLLPITFLLSCTHKYTYGFAYIMVAEELCRLICRQTEGKWTWWLLAWQTNKWNIITFAYIDGQKLPENGN